MTREQRAQAKAANLCTTCGKRPPMPSLCGRFYESCDSCYAERATIRERNRAAKAKAHAERIRRAGLHTQDGHD